MIGPLESALGPIIPNSPPPYAITNTNCIEVNNELVTDNKEICNNFNDYFTTVADKILRNNRTPILKSFDKYLPERNSNSFVF